MPSSTEESNAADQPRYALHSNTRTRRAAKIGELVLALLAELRRGTGGSEEHTESSTEQMESMEQRLKDLEVRVRALEANTSVGAFVTKNGDAARSPSH